MAIVRKYFITMHHQAGVHFENFTEVKIRDSPGQTETYDRSTDGYRCVTADGVHVTSALRLATLVAAAPAFCQPSLYTYSSAVTSFSQILCSLVLQREYYVFMCQLFVLASHVVYVGSFCCAPTSKHFQPLLLITSFI